MTVDKAAAEGTKLPGHHELHDQSLPNEFPAVDGGEAQTHFCQSVDPNPVHFRATSRSASVLEESTCRHDSERSPWVPWRIARSSVHRPVPGSSPVRGVFEAIAQTRRRFGLRLGRFGRLGPWPGRRAESPVRTGVSDAGAGSRLAARALGLDGQSRGPTATPTVPLAPLAVTLRALALSG